MNCKSGMLCFRWPSEEGSATMRVRLASTFLRRLRGLIARPKGWLADDEVLAITPCNCIHTFGMRHSLDVAFLDDAGRVLRVQEGVAPGRIVKCKGASAVLERYAR